MTPAKLTLSERLYAALLRWYPSDFRRDFAPDMRELFRDHLRAARSRAGVRGVAMLWLRAIPDLLFTGLHEHEDHMLQAILQDARYAVRVLRKNPLFTSVAILVVALGTGAVSTIYSVANAIVLRPIPGVSRPSDVVAIQRTQGDGQGSMSASYLYYKAIAAQSRTMQGIAAWSMLDLTVGTGDEGTLAHANLVTGNFFDVLGVRPAVGRFFAADEDRDGDPKSVVVISNEFWHRRFDGDSAIVGRRVLVNGRQFAVIGVAPPRFSGLFPVMRIDAWVPMVQQPVLRGGGDLLHSPTSAWLELVGRVAPGIGRDAAHAELTVLTKQFAASVDAPKSKRLARFTGVELDTESGLPADATKGVIAFFVVLLAVAGLVLLIASVNVASMLLARAISRRREIAVRMALGAARRRLVRQLLTESVLLFSAGGAAGVLVAIGGTRLLSLVPLPVDVPLSLDLTPDARVLGVTLAVALITGVAFGLAPALQGSRFDIAATLRGSGSGRARSRLRTTLVAAQIAASMLLLTASGLFVRALARGHNVDPGFDVTHVATTSFDLAISGYDTARARVFYATLRQRIAARPGVIAAGYTRVMPLSMNRSGYTIKVPGYVPESGRASDEITSSAALVDDGFFPTVRLPVVEGRAIAPTDDERAPRVVVISQTFAKHFWPKANAIGRTFEIEGVPTTVIGVTRDVHFSRLDGAPEEFMYLPIAQNWHSQTNLVVRTSGAAADVIPAIRAEVHALDRNVPLAPITTLEAATAVVLLPQRTAVVVTATLGGLGVLLAAIGLYGVLAFSIAQRTREIGVRMALGAASDQVVRMIIGEGLRVVAIGVVVGLVLAAIATRALAPFLFGVSPLDASTFAIVAAALGAIGLLASWGPARRAADADPMAALRQD